MISPYQVNSLLDNYFLLHDKQAFARVLTFGGDMKIEVDRTATDKELVFTIRVTEPNIVKFSHEEKQELDFLERLLEMVAGVNDHNAYTITTTMVDQHKQKMYGDARNALSQVITWHFQDRSDQICQEIYNWVYDMQNEDLKAWMNEFNPCRTKYYFDNDRTAESDDE